MTTATLAWSLVSFLVAAAAVRTVQILRLGHRLKSVSHESLTGEWALTQTELNPQGIILVRGERRRAHSAIALAPGQAVRIVAESELLEVKPWSD